VPKGRGARCHELTMPNVDDLFYRDIEVAAGAQPHDISFIAEAKAAPSLDAAPQAAVPMAAASQDAVPMAEDANS
jgi:hypothetical protein